MKPRILTISPVTPYPVHHGAGSTIYGYIRALREVFDIFYVGFCPEWFQSAGKPEKGAIQLLRSQPVS